jgi:preprotein translocase subunit SecG
MHTVIIAIHLIVVIALVAVVLLQRSEGGALGIGGGGGFLTGRGQANALTRATAILAALFFATSLILTVMANMNRAPKSIFDGVQQPGQTQGAPAGQGGSVLDQLKQIEQQQQQAPAAPATPAAPEPPRQ